MPQTAPFNLRLSVMQLLGSQEAISLVAAAGISAADQWPQVIELCRRWKTLSALETRLSNLGIRLPPSERSDLSRLATQVFIQSNLSIRAGMLALKALEQAGLRCAGFKGMAAIAYLYPGARSRILQDVDILIDPGSVQTAFAALESHGYRRSFPGELDEYLKFIRNAPGTVGNEAMSFTDKAGGSIDLHWRLGAIDTETLLARVRQISILHHELPLLDPGHCLLLCVHHALRNDFVPDDIARDVLDFPKWIAYVDDHGAWQSLHADIEGWGLTQGCLALDAIMACLHRGPKSPLAATAAPTDVRSAKRIADLYLHQLQYGPLNTDLVYLTSGKPWTQIAVGLVTGWRQYRSHMQQFESLNGEQSLTLASRANRFLRSAMQLAPLRWLQLRALSRAKDGITR